MNRIDRIFTDLRRRGGKALMPFITAGDPDLAATGALLPALQRAGAGICELGVPFSDPIADGPVIQASMTHALTHHVRPAQVLQLVADVRAQLSLGLVAMLSYSIVHRLGVESFIRDAGQAGLDGFIFPDLPIEEAGPVRDAAGKADLACVFLIAPTTSEQRAAAIAQACSGFVYVLSRAGITGERRELPPELAGRLQRLRRVTELPIAVGFGIATAQHVRQVVRVADAAIVGSAIMRRIADRRAEPTETVVRHVETFVSELAGGLSASDRSAVRAPG